MVCFLFPNWLSSISTVLSGPSIFWTFLKLVTIWSLSHEIVGDKVIHLCKKVLQERVVHSAKFIIIIICSVNWHERWFWKRVSGKLKWPLNS